MRMSKSTVMAIFMIAIISLISGAAFSADPGQVVPKQKAPAIPYQQAPLSKSGASFTCTYQPSESGIGAGGQLGGTGVFNYGMSINVKNVGTTGVYGVYGNLVVKVNGTNKNKTCNLPPDIMLNQFTLASGKSASHTLNCGTESNVTTSNITSSAAYVERSSDGKKFNCTLAPAEIPR